jgi:hypothetical protein
MKRAASSFRLTSHWPVALVVLASCSLQNFDYLKEAAGSGGSSGGGAGGSVPAAGGRGGQQSGSSNASEGGSGEPARAGSSGSSGGPSEAGKGGTGGTGTEPLGNGGVIDEGGNGGVAGEGTGNTGNTGAVGQLENPSFENSNTLGWTVEPTDALTKRHAFVQPPQGTATVPDGNYEFSTWHMTDAFVVELHQTVTGLEDGTYTFKGYFSRGDGFNAVTMFARNCGGVDPEPVPVPLTDPSQWLNVEVTGIEVVGGSCDVGLRIDSNPVNWLNADLFSLEKAAE